MKLLLLLLFLSNSVFATTNNLLDIYYPAGTYYLSDTLVVPALPFPNNPVLGDKGNYHIHGDGITRTKLIWTNSNVGLDLTSPLGWGFEGVVIENLSLIGPGLNYSNISTGLILGHTNSFCWSGKNNLIRNCAIINWNIGSIITSQWLPSFDNCIIRSNNIEGLRFVGSHCVNVSNCQLGGGWITPCKIAIGFHPPPNACYGDNAQIVNCLIGPAIHGIFNQELILTSINNHLESCGSYYTLSNSSGLPSTTIIGGYTLDYAVPYTNEFIGQVLMDTESSSRTIFENCQFTSGFWPARPVFNVIGTQYKAPTYIGPIGYLSGVFNTNISVKLYPIGYHPYLWNRKPNNNLILRNINSQ